MADGNFPTLVSKDTGANAVANPIFVELTDGSSAVTITSGAIKVFADNLDIRDLVKGTGTGEDNVLIFANTVKDGSGTDYVPLVDSDGQLQVDVLSMPGIAFDTSYADDSAFTYDTSKVNAIGAVFDDTGTNTTTENNVAHVRATGRAILLTTIADPTTDTQRLAVNASGQIAISNTSFAVTASDLDIRNLNLTDDAVKVSANATANSSTNPIYVSVVSAGVSTTEIHDYGTTVDTGNNDYTVTGTTFLLKSVIFAASGGMKAEIQVGPLATLVTKAVGFIPHQGGTQQLFFDPPIECPSTSTGTVRVVMTNREGAAQSVYSTIIGNDIP